MLLIKQILFIVGLFYVIVLAFLYLQQRKFIFFPTQTKHSTPRGGAEFTIQHNKATLQGWILQEQFISERLIIYYGGNAEDIYYATDQFDNLGDTAALLVNYRGYGASTGSPGEQELFDDALAIFDEIGKRYSPKKIVLMGRSLGSGVASFVAAHRKVQGIILITPFDSITSIAKRQYPFFPIEMLLHHKFNSLDYAPKFSAPSLVIYGGRDNTVLPAQTKKLLEHMDNSPTVVFIEEAEHNNIELFDEYNLAVLEFIHTHFFANDPEYP